MVNKPCMLGRPPVAPVFLTRHLRNDVETIAATHANTKLYNSISLINFLYGRREPRIVAECCGQMRDGLKNI